MKFLDNINPEEYTLYAIIIGYLLKDNFNANELNSLGNWFMLVGQVLETISAQLQVVQQNNTNNTVENKQNNDIENLKKAVDIINSKLNKSFNSYK